MEMASLEMGVEAVERSPMKQEKLLRLPSLELGARTRSRLISVCHVRYSTDRCPTREIYACGGVDPIPLGE
jgi:hypothetical protein